MPAGSPDSRHEHPPCLRDAAAEGTATRRAVRQRGIKAVPYPGEDVGEALRLDSAAARVGHGELNCPALRRI